MEKRIIFVPHYKESFKTLLLLAQYVRSNALGIPCFIIYFDDNMEIQQTLKEQGIDFTIYKIKSFTGIPIVDKIIKLVVDLIYSFKLVNHLSPVQAMVCVVESNRLEYALISVLNRKKINTLVLQWAQTTPWENRYYTNRSGVKSRVSIAKNRLKDFMNWFIIKVLGVKYTGTYGTGDAKFFAVMGEYYTTMFREQGVPENKLVSTGHPEHDYLYELSLNIKNPGFKRTVLESFGLDGAKPLWIVAREAIVYFKLVPEEKDKQDICTILEILSRYHPDVQVVLKLHPRDLPEYYEFVKEKFPSVILIHECEFYKLIAVCDLYISQISSTMMWAIAMDKPVISYDFNNQQGWHYFRNREGVVKADTPEILAEKVKNITGNGLSPEVYQQYQAAKKRYMVLDGKACERIAGLIMRNSR